MKTIAVGVDGSDGAHAALRWAVAEARQWGATLRILSAWTFPAMVASAPVGTLPTREEMDTAQQILCNNVLEEEGVADADDLDLEIEVIEGSSAKALVEASKDVDLLVVGARGLGGFMGLVMGSTSQHVAAHAECPVVVVRAGEA